MVAKLAKPISPKKLKAGKVRLNLLNALRAEGRIVKREFEKTTATWTGAKPKFELSISLKGGDASVIISPGGSEKGAQKWIWLDEGTKPHIIKAKNVPNLVFRTDFTPKTKIKSFSSSPGSINPPWRKTPKVNHPGTKARGWSKEAVELRQKPFGQAMTEAAKI